MATGASEEFKATIRRIAYGAGSPNPQDLKASRAWTVAVDAIAEELWSEAHAAGVQHAEEKALVWHFPLREEA